VRSRRRLALLTSATALLSAVGIGLTPAVASAATPVFGYGTPGFTVSEPDFPIQFTPVLQFTHPDQSGEPSIGIDWNTGAGMYMAGTNTLKITWDGAGNATWSDASPYFGTAQNLDPILATDPVSGTTIAGGDTGACSAMFSSTDDGDSWLPSVPCTGAADHPMVAPAPSALTPGARVWYYCQQTTLDNCATSYDDGLTWLPGANLSFDCTYQHGHLRAGPDGVAYLPSSNCFDADSTNLIGGLRTSDDGTTWTGYTIPGAATPASGFDPAVTVTPDNTLYEAWDRAGDHHPVIARSADHGATWSQPVDLAATVSPPLVASTFATLTSGDNGRVAYTFLGTSVGEQGVDPFATGFHGVWYAYTSYTYDGGQTWTTVRDTPTPLQYGEIDAGGTTTAGQRNLLDFIDSSVTKDGRVVVALADGCLADCEAKGAQGDQAGAEELSTHAWTTVAYQSTGKGLFAAYDVAVAPGSPTLSATGGSTPSLSWTVPDDGGAPITSYSVLRKAGAGSESVVATTPGTSFTDTTAPAGQSVTYRVVATNSAGTGTPSNAVTVTTGAAPAAPVLAAAEGLEKVSLTWAPPADNGSAVTGYVLSRGTSSGGETPLATLGAVTSYTDTAVTPGTQYFYALRATNAVGTSPSSAEVAATPYTTASAPTLTATGGKGQVRLAWTTPADGGRAITGYQVYRGLAPGAETLVQTISTGTSYIDAVTGGVTYYYRVAAVTAAGSGALSNEASATPKK
jgi:fibronectin type 3 domain-containing protein